MDNKMEEVSTSKNFIEQIIDKDLEEGHYNHIQTKLWIGTKIQW